MKFWIAFVVVIGLIGGVLGVSRSARMQARAEAAPLDIVDPFKPAAKPWTAPDGKVYTPIAADPGPEPVVDRGLLGGCPTGYVDHPADPKKCVLPIVAERMLNPRR